MQKINHFKCLPPRQGAYFNLLNKLSQQNPLSLKQTTIQHIQKRGQIINLKSFTFSYSFQPFPYSYWWFIIQSKTSKAFWFHFNTLQYKLQSGKNRQGQGPRRYVCSSSVIWASLFSSKKKQANIWSIYFFQISNSTNSITVSANHSLT